MTAKSIHPLYFIDRWIGSCLCFALTIVYRLLSIFNKPSEKKTIKNILIIQLSEMGSIILSYPALVQLNQKYKDANIYLLTFKQQSSLIELLPLTNMKINQLLISVQSIFGFFISVFRLIFHLWKYPFDMVIDFERFSRFSAAISGLSFAPVRVGFSRYTDEGLYRGDFFTHSVWYNNYQHISVNFVSMIQSLDFPSKSRPMLQATVKKKSDIPVYTTSVCQISSIRQKIIQNCPSAEKAKLWVLFNVGSGEPLPIRSWPMDYFQTLAEMILSKYSAVIILVGQMDAQENARYLCNRVEKGRCWDMTGNLELNELMDLFGCSDILITPDSGMAHLASMTHIRSIVLFGPETPLRYSPLGDNHKSMFADYSCSPCFSPHNNCQTICTDAKCLKSITPEHVFSEFHKMVKD